MKFQTCIVMVLNLTFFAPLITQAESLNCRELGTYRQASMTINRDGSIGFNGTAIDLQASWFFDTGFENVAQLSGREKDAALQPSAISLYLSPKGACTANNDSLSKDFSCSAKGADIDLTGHQFQPVTDGSAVTSEEVTRRMRMKVDVQLNAKITAAEKGNRQISLTVTLTNNKTARSIKLSENMLCEVEK